MIKLSCDIRMSEIMNISPNCLNRSLGCAFCVCANFSHNRFCGWFCWFAIKCRIWFKFVGHSNPPLSTALVCLRLTRLTFKCKLLNFLSLSLSNAFSPNAEKQFTFTQSNLDVFIVCRSKLLTDTTATILSNGFFSQPPPVVSVRNYRFY